MSTINNYYRHPAVSNSTLSALEKELSSKDQYDTAANFSYGRLVHAFLGEPHKVDHIYRVYDGEEYDPETFKHAKSTAALAKKDPFISTLLSTCEKEIEVYNYKKHYHIDGIGFTLDTRMKADLLRVPICGDFKTTDCTTQTSFEECIDRFSWDRQAWFYMDNSGARKFVLIGLRKDGRGIFKTFINWGDQLCERGRAKGEKLLLNYYFLKV